MSTPSLLPIPKTVGFALALMEIKNWQLEAFQDGAKDAGLTDRYGNGGEYGFGPEYFGLSPETGGGSAA